MDTKLPFWDILVRRIPVLRTAIEVVDIIQYFNSQSQVYIVGGIVRDFIKLVVDFNPNVESFDNYLNRIDVENVFNDIDIATNVPIDTVEGAFKCHDIGKNKDFGILVIEYKGEVFEVANFREDGEYSDNRRPDSVKIIDNFQGDASRRDFTINAMGVDKSGSIYDYFDGIGDIAQGYIQCVGNPENRFTEDYLRMLRAVRFSAKMGYSIEKNTMEAIKKHAKRIVCVSSERILKELNKMAELTGEQFAHGIEMMRETTLLEYILPEIHNMIGLKQSYVHHPEGWFVEKVEQ